MIAKITDTGDHILVSCTCDSAASVTAAGGVVNGTVTFPGDGMDTSAGGGISFTNITGHERLDYEGQIVLKAETRGVCTRDNNAAAVTFSPGVTRTAGTVYLFSARTSGASNMGYISATNGNVLTTKTQNADTAQSPKFNGVSRGTFTEICLWWRGNQWGYLIDGASPDPSNMPYTRADEDAGAYYLMNFGAAFAGTTSPFEYKIKDVVVSTDAPRFNVSTRYRSFGIFGDSFAANSAATNAGERIDTTLEAELHRKFSEDGLRVHLSANGGHSGHTLCTTGATDLETYWTTDTTFIDANPQIVICMAGNNDVFQTAAAIANGTNGTEKKCQEFITALSGNPQIEKVILCTSGSLIGNTSQNTTDYRTNTTTVNNIIRSIPGWWDTNNPTNTGFVKVFDLHQVLGDSLGNDYYQGELNYVGNEAVAGTGAYDDRHPSGIGHKRIADKLYPFILEAMK